MRKILLTLISVLALAALVACGSSNGSTSTPGGPTTGNNAGFSTSSLNGTYVFSGNGVNGSNNNFNVIGVFTADGAGNVTSGFRDTYADSGAQSQKEAITGTYTVNQDGRGQVTLNGSKGQAVYRFVMQSPSSASFFQFSSNTDDTGRLQLQSAAVTNVIGPETFVVRLDGEDSSGNAYSAIGALNVSGGTTLAGTIDQNDNGTFLGQLAATGTISTADSTGRGTLSFTTSSGTHNFVYYRVSPSHIELASTDSKVLLFGYADLQTSVSASVAAFTGPQVFSISGYGPNGPLLETGLFGLDGGGNLTGGIEDYNSAGTYVGSAPFTGTYTVGANGRWTAAEGGVSSNLVGWQVSPQQSVVLSWNSTSNVLETGTLRAQTAGITTASVVGEYAVDVSGFNIIDNGYVESTANYLADGQGNLNGTMDSQTPGYYNTDYTETGTYAILANGRSPASIAGVPVIIYTVDANTMYLISSDSNRMYQGKMLAQQAAIE